MSGRASKRGDEVSAWRLFAAAEENSARRHRAATRTDNVLRQFGLGAIFTRRRIALFFLRESDFTFSQPQKMNATRGYVLALLDSDEID